jgi:hypothetical protein
MDMSGNPMCSQQPLTREIGSHIGGVTGCHSAYKANKTSFKLFEHAASVIGPKVWFCDGSYLLTSTEP